ncbi:hypothetical protein OHC33_002367 [Knufia fluminis]|uniref:Uncharacterized protein n=1 Tax=Knufia fluminis TaxID=191047 RepID=A0AAN8F569_9EURO|nr:hypothetical protein OHC33_002367 [Knufia fluminis]
MSPTVMRSCKKKNDLEARTHDSSSGPSTRSKTASSASTTARGKRATATRRSSHPLAETPITMPADDSLPPSMPTSYSLPDDLSTLLDATATSTAQELQTVPSYYDDSFAAPSASTSQEAQPASSYQEDSFDAQMQGSLTFTVESQPMSDLSSSQQQNT